MLRYAFEKGMASLLARWMLESKGDALFRSIERAGALPPEEIAQLRADRKKYLERVRDEGAPYAEVVRSALNDMQPSVSELTRGAPAAAMGMAARALKAVEATLEKASDASGSTPGSDPGES